MNKRIKYLLYGSNIWYLGEGMFGPLMAVFTEKIGGDILDISWAWATYLLVTGALMIFFGKMSDKINKEKMMVAGYAVNCLFTFSYLFVDSPIELFIVQGGLGFANSLATPTWSALYAKYEDEGKDGMEWGLANGAAAIVTGIAIIIGGIITSFLSFKILFITMGTIQLLATIYQAKILKKT